jgi:hypothetical protein
MRISIKLRAGLVRLILFLTLVSCGNGTPAPTTGIPTFDAGQSGISVSPTTPPANRLWGTRPFGVDQVVIIFSEPQCVGYQLGEAQAVSSCTGGGTVIGVQGVATDSNGTQYTIIAGRTFSDKVSVVAVELDKGENTPAPVTDHGFALVLPGTRHAVALVPIDQFGNLVGERVVLK